MRSRILKSSLPRGCQGPFPVQLPERWEIYAKCGTWFPLGGFYGKCRLWLQFDAFPPGGGFPGQPFHHLPLLTPRRGGRDSLKEHLRRGAEPAQPCAFLSWSPSRELRLCSRGRATVGGTGCTNSGDGYRAFHLETEYQELWGPHAQARSPSAILPPAPDTQERRRGPGLGWPGASAPLWLYLGSSSYQKPSPFALSLYTPVLSDLD